MPQKTLEEIIKRQIHQCIMKIQVLTIKAHLTVANLTNKNTNQNEINQRSA